MTQPYYRTRKLATGRIFFFYACKQNSLSYSEALASNWLAQVKPWKKTVFDLPPASCN